MDIYTIIISVVIIGVIITINIFRIRSEKQDKAARNNYQFNRMFGSSNNYNTPFQAQSQVISYGCTINKPRNIVWKVILDESKRPEWNQGKIKKVSKWEEGGIIEWEMGGESKIIVFEENKELSTESHYLIKKIKLIDDNNNSTHIEIIEMTKNGSWWSDGGRKETNMISEDLSKLKELCNKII